LIDESHGILRGVSFVVFAAAREGYGVGYCVFGWTDLYCLCYLSF
jgi:hypothetical protein